MFRGLVISAGKLRADLSQHRSPNAIALGVALGTTLGLLPIDNLIWVLLFVALLFLPVHQLAAVATWSLVGLLSSYLTVVPEAVGEWLLSWESIRWFAVQCHSIPLGPWFRLNNTLVLGSLAIGTTGMILHWVATRALAPQGNRMRSVSILDDSDESLRAYRKASKREITASIPSIDRTPLGSLTNAVAIPAEQENRETHRASEATAVVLEPKSTAISESTKGHSLRLDSAHGPRDSGSSEGAVHHDHVTIRETFIEVVRLRATQPSLPSPTNNHSNAMITESQLSEVLVSANDQVALSSQSTDTNMSTKETVVTRLSPAHQQLSGPKSSNSLRFLLSHLASHRGAQDGQESDSSVSGLPDSGLPDSGLSDSGLSDSGLSDSGRGRAQA